MPAAAPREIVTLFMSALRVQHSSPVRISSPDNVLYNTKNRKAFSQGTEWLQIGTNHLVVTRNSGSGVIVQVLMLRRS